tara:strand:- start:730 stop:2181 length:1452 start_codon:yes stop_codon:yes gene_type:complete
METLTITKVNEVYMTVDCDGGSCWELQDYFTFAVPGMQFMPAVRNKVWDGKIRLFNPMTKRMYSGLIPHVQRFCKERDYNLIIADEYAAEAFSIDEANDFIETLGISLTPRDYQVDAFAHAIKNRRALLLSPTASGKSLIIYLITQYYKKKTLLIVPTVSLVQQMAGDFKDYGYKDECHLISAGVDKESTEDIVISTWQSLYKMPKKWFQQFDVVIGDEAHLFKAKSLTSIMTKLDQCAYRFGFTGTLDDAQTHKLVLEGLFGGIEKVTTTAALIEDGTLAEFKVRCIVLQYPDIVKQAHAKDKYPDEVDFLVRNEARNKFIRNLALSLKGNTLLLFNFVEKHGKPLHQSIKHSIDKSVDKRPLYYVSGEVSGSDREDIRHIVEQQDNAIIVASFGTFSTGINIKQLNNIIFASPSKSRIRVMQSIGRGLRKSETKTEATLFDIADNLTWKSKSNFTINHFAERLKMYNDEKFEYKMYKVKIK